jgi:hypothetical protein
MLLARYGGSASVWAISMFFFPAVLLGGYAYSRYASRRPKVAAALVLASLVLLPVRIWQPSLSSHPIIDLLCTLVLSIGLSFFALSATSPTVQCWFPSYRLYALSNAASLAALLAYPFLIEPYIGRSAQLRLWSVLYFIYAAMFAFIAFRSKAAEPSDDDGAAGNWPLWIALSAIPAALWLSVANQISQSVAPVPLLWILPLSVYLLTLILCFEGNWYRGWLFKWLSTPAVAVLLLASKQHHWNTSLPLGLALYLSGLFVLAMICHGELSARKPRASNPTRFYLAVAAGGALGSAFTSLLAPVLFPGGLEFYVALVACILVILGLLYFRLSTPHVIRLIVVSGLALAYTEYQQGGGLRLRNFYGTLEIHDTSKYRVLSNGTIIHGVQFRDASLTREATAYYAKESPIGQILSEPAAGPRKVGLVGLGAGTLAVYARPGDTFRFYEINPAVVDVAMRHFNFVKEAKGRVEIVRDDARLALQREKPQHYDVLVVDAFSGDAVPTHLLTREAFQLYLGHLKPDGILALHVTGKYLRLAPIVARIAASFGLASQTLTNRADAARQVMSSTWVIVRLSDRGIPSGEINVWTDDHVNLLEALR